VSDEKTRIRRLPERAVTEQEAINRILDEGLVCHAGYITDGRPVVIPTLYVRDDERLLLHGSNSMGLARAVRRGSPLSVAITLLDGLVVARSAFNSSANYRSVVIHGYGALLEGDAKADALDVVVDKLIPGRLADLRSSTDSEIAQTAVIGLSLAETSAKVRTGPPDDDPEDLRASAWAGVIPVAAAYGEAIADPDLKPGIDLPDYLNPYRR
jgi:nitroimidazol reductase NimA-like FMN-containing flavoprotein (pyridoxamine 5'-phosphate oxidase superfamily)